MTHPVLCLFDPPAHESDFAADAAAGLARRPKQIPSKYFYDECGSALFERICVQPEYYLTTTELAILAAHAQDIAAAIGPRSLLVEYGSGSGLKTRELLAALTDPVGYVPVEISRSALRESIGSLSREFPQLQMLPVCADFTAPFRLPTPFRRQRRSVIFFPGSTLGNFDHRDATRLLQQMRWEMGAGGAAVVGIDLQKDPAIIEAAYNDAAGVTAQFTLNLLSRMNRELGADFNLSRFRHRATYNALAGRIETHIISCVEQQVHVGAQTIHFAANEAMLVEYSHKYSQAGFERLAAKVGLRVVRRWTDPRQWFAIEMLERLG